MNSRFGWMKDGAGLVFAKPIHLCVWRRLKGVDRRGCDPLAHMSEAVGAVVQSMNTRTVIAFLAGPSRVLLGRTSKILEPDQHRQRAFEFSVEVDFIPRQF